MNVPLLSMKILRSLLNDGMTSTFRRVVSHLQQKPITNGFDARHGTHTGGHEPLWKFDIASPNARYGVRYQPTTESEFREAVRFLRVSPSHFTFIDLGCGKGLTLLLAAHMGFRKVLGVEFVREFSEIARANLVKMKIANGSISDGDAADYEFPAGNLIIYLYNPFSEEVMIKVIENLRRAAAANDEIYVIYKMPKCSAVLDAAEFLSKIGCPLGYDYITIWRSRS
jgi:predicted RNA methylase